MIEPINQGHEAAIDEAPAGGAAQGFRGVAQVVSCQSIAEESRRAEIEQADQGFAHLRARLKCAGYSVSIVTGTNGPCAYLVSRWAFHRELIDRAALDVFALQAGVT